MAKFSLTELLELETPITIVDVGASFLETPPYQGLVEKGNAVVIGFEPNQAEVEKLSQIYSATHKFFPYFIGDGKEGVFYETNWVATGSLYKPNPEVLDKFHILGDVTRLVAEHPVMTKALDDIPEIGDVDYFKIDIQGGELKAFTGASHALASSVLLHTEVEFIEMYIGQPLFSDVDIYLRDKGFKLVKYIPPFTPSLKPTVLGGSPYNGSIWTGTDAIYFKDWNRLDLIPTGKLKKWAVIAHDVYEMLDVVYFLLQELDRREGGTLAGRYLERCGQ